MRYLILVLLACMTVSSCNKRELHTHEKEYEWLQEIETEKRRVLNTTLANLAIQYANKSGAAEDIAELVVDACAIQIEEVVAAAGEVKTAERGGGLERESEVDTYKENLQKNLRKKLWQEVTKIISAERAKKNK